MSTSGCGNGGCDTQRTLGRLEGLLQAVRETQEAHGATLGVIDGRLQQVERTTAVHSAVGGGVAGAAMAAMIELIKANFPGAS